jgi:DNA-binding NtrC family response regulator
LNVISIKAPSLRSRKIDIPLFVNHFIRRLNQRAGVAIEGISLEATEVLHGYDWPGNVRELENVIERAAIIKRVGRIEPEDLGVLGAKDARGARRLCEKGKSEAEVKVGEPSRNPALFLQMNMASLNERLRKSKLAGAARSARSSAL